LNRPFVDRVTKKLNSTSQYSKTASTRKPF